MDHLAIMNKAWQLIPKILNGEKTIESRWYQSRRTPWQRVKIGEWVYFKNAGEKVTTRAQVSDVRYFAFQTDTEIDEVIQKYGKAIGLINRDWRTWERKPRYAILVFLQNPESIAPFSINKTGFGNAAAWLTMNNINDIKLI